MKNIDFALLGLALITVLGCSGMKTVRFETFPSQVVFKVATNGTQSKKILKDDDPLIELMRKWCDNNTSGWHRSYDSFAPSFEFRGTNLWLNVRSDFVVANIERSKGRWEQLVKPTPQDLWKELNKLAASPNETR